MTPPRATYRLQLNKNFTLADATALVPYLEALGISHAYLSPVLTAQPGSLHGYDTVDHTRINPEIGTLDDFRELAKALEARGMGIILDFVPNHMGIGGHSNALWLDVLRHGPVSRYADWFDIDWNPPRPGMTGKVLVPFLGKAFAEVLAEGDIALKADEDGFAVWAYDKEKLPIRPEDGTALLEKYGDIDAVLAAHADHDKLQALIALQHWRLAHFATAGDEINYRRFFINSELAGIRVERPEVFDHAHGLIFSLIEEGLVAGLRIDHVDGLRDPTGYLQTLRAKSPRPIYLAVEKILAPHEYLRADWPVEGTTGYEIGADLTRVLTQARGEKALTATYESVVGPVLAPHEEAHHCKLRVMDNELAVELTTLAEQTAQLAWSVPQSSDLTAAALRRAWKETIAQLEVYRTYADRTGLAGRDRREIALAMGRARLAQPQIQPAVFDFIEALLGQELDDRYNQDQQVDIAACFQQVSGPVMAKGLEDTALYRYNRLVSLNEVGAHPDRFSLAIPAFHDRNMRRLRRHPHGLVGTSTHDTKRGEDTRLFIAALADDPARWTEAVLAWQKMLGHDLDGIDRNDFYLLVQMLMGGWPLLEGREELGPRLKGAMTKSLREARERSDWGVANTAYEEQLGDLIDILMGRDDFLESFEAVRAHFGAIGRRKALIHVGLKYTIPGVPDVYRGAEDWEQSFVDPDNRRPLNFAALAERLERPVVGLDDKLVMTQRLLVLRREHPGLFAQGIYEPLALGADRLGFRRRQGQTALTVIADLSPGHSAGLGRLPAGSLVAGSPEGPIAVIV